MARLYENFITGVTDSILNVGATTLSSPILAALPVVGGGDIAVLVLDPEDVGNGPEVVHVTTHTASATTATIVRAQEGTSDVQHVVGTKVIAPLTAAAIEEIVAAITTNAGNITTNSDNFSAHDQVGGTGVHPLVISDGTAGFMSGTDKLKLDGIEDNATDDLTSAEAIALLNQTNPTSLNAGYLEGHDSAYFATAHSHPYEDAGAVAAHDASGSAHSTLFGNKLNVTNPVATGTLYVDNGSDTHRASIYHNNTTGFVEFRRGSQAVISSDGASCYMLGIGINAGATYEVRCTDTGSNGRQMWMRDDSSTERNKTDIEVTERDGGECLRWDMYEFRRKVNGPDSDKELWTIAERIQETSGDQFIVRDIDGEIANTDDRAMLADVILTLQEAYRRIEALEARVSELEA